MKRIVIREESNRQAVFDLVRRVPATGAWAVIFKETSTRNLAQNSKMWGMLADISSQVIWYGSRLTSEEWKTIFTAGLKKTRIVPDIDGTGFVSLGASTSRMTVAEMAELIELITAFGAEHKVRFRAIPT